MALAAVGASHGRYLKEQDPITKDKGHWLGEGAKALGLDERDTRRTIERLMEGTGLVRKQHNHRVGWDLVQSAPASVNAFFAIGSADQQEQILTSQRVAVEEMVKHLEQEHAFVRSGGVFKQAQLVARVVDHAVSRAGDPQIHSHVMIFNLGRAHDGHWRVLYSPEIYKAQRELQSFYDCELANQLEKRLGVTIERAGESFRIAEIPKDLEKVFSTRRRQIEEHMEDRKARGLKASPQIANFATRPAKQEFTEAELRQRWQEKVQEQEVSKLFNQEPRRDVAARLKEALEAAKGRGLRQALIEAQDKGIPAWLVRDAIRQQPLEFERPKRIEVELLR